MKKIISIFTMITIIFSNIMIVSASEIYQKRTNHSETLTYISEKDVPSFISYSELIDDGIVARIKSEETDLMTAVFVDDNNIRTRYVFSQPIKYENNGKIEDIDNSIVEINNPTQIENGYSYKNKSNDIKTLFPKALSKETNIKIIYNNYEIIFSPVTEYVSSATERKNIESSNDKNNVIYYHNAFGPNTALRYAPNYSGLKEDIILNEYNGNNVFEFRLILKDVNPICNGESIALINDNDEIISVIGQVDARDSYVGDSTDNHFTLNNKTTLISTQNPNEYLLRIQVDEEFLSSPETVYPVVIDPNVSINKSYHKDTTVYDNKATTNFWSSSYNNVGNHGSTYGTAIAFVQFDLSSFKDIPNDGITSAIYRVYEGSGKTNSSTINIRQPASTWTDTTLKWENKPSISTTNITSKTISKSGYYEFEIKKLIKSYIKNVRNEGGANPKRGFAMVASNSNSSSKHFCSAQHGTYPPVLKITYSNYQLLGMKWESRSCKFKINSLSTAFQNGVRTAINDWNSQNINFSFGIDNSSSNINTVTTKSSGMNSDTVAYCEYSWYTDSMTFISAKIVFNTQHHTFSEGKTASNFHIASIARHELGHALGLADLYIDSNEQAIMYGYSNKNEIVTIKAADVKGAQAIYGAK